TKLSLKRSAKPALCESEFRQDTDKASFVLRFNPDIVSETEHLVKYNKNHKPHQISDSYSKSRYLFLVTKGVIKVKNNEIMLRGSEGSLLNIGANDTFFRKTDNMIKEIDRYFNPYSGKKL
ncbi:MAG: hypothetical protein GY754_22985, partial [bacterium]|nr:hypothetical protein [bacterium]